MDVATAGMLTDQYAIIDEMVALSKEFFEQGAFDEHFMLKAFQEAMPRPHLRQAYERAIGGDAYPPELPACACRTSRMAVSNDCTLSATCAAA